jgi:hypothetical protein
MGSEGDPVLHCGIILIRLKSSLCLRRGKTRARSRSQGDLEQFFRLLARQCITNKRRSPTSTCTDVASELSECLSAGTSDLMNSSLETSLRTKVAQKGLTGWSCSEVGDTYQHMRSLSPLDSSQVYGSSTIGRCSPSRPKSSLGSLENTNTAHTWPSDSG